MYVRMCMYISYATAYVNHFYANSDMFLFALPHFFVMKYFTSVAHPIDTYVRINVHTYIHTYMYIFPHLTTTVQRMQVLPLLIL